MNDGVPGRTSSGSGQRRRALGTLLLGLGATLFAGFGIWGMSGIQRSAISIWVLLGAAAVVLMRVGSAMSRGPLPDRAADETTSPPS